MRTECGQKSSLKKECGQIMTISIKILKAKKANEFGYAIIILCSQGQNRKSEEIGRAWLEDFDIDNSNVKDSHPQFDILMPKIVALKLKARKILASGCEDPDEALFQLVGTKSTTLVRDFGAFHVQELRTLAKRLEKDGDLKERNRKNGLAIIYENTINQFCEMYPNVTFEKLDYNLLMKFKQARLLKGNSKATVSLYLRNLRALYNKAQKVYKFKDEKPFTGIFDGLTLKATNNKKKYLKKKGIRKIEKCEHFSPTSKKYTDLFMLQFYFGGCDLTDIYFLKKQQIVKNRVFFDRGKTGVDIDLKIHPKALDVIERWKDESSDEWLFPWRKDDTGYKTFRRRHQAFLMKVQKREKIEIYPSGGNIGAKVARHTFATMAKRLYINEDILREIMGHEREDVDQFYKDKHTRKVRDKALFDVIEAVNKKEKKNKKTL